jgi:hypothetical protein
MPKEISDATFAVWKNPPAGAVLLRIPLAIREQRRISIGRGAGEKNNHWQWNIKNPYRMQLSDATLAAHKTCKYGQD